MSETFEIETPESKAVSKIRKAYVVDINRNARVGDLHVCYEVLFDEDDEPCLLVDDGVCFLHDTKEFGHYVLWNDATGELSVSEELETAVRDDWRRTNPAYIIAKAKCISESDDYAFATEGEALCALRAPRGRRQSGRGRIHSMVKNGRIYQVVFVDLSEAATAA